MNLPVSSQVKQLLVSPTFELSEWEWFHLDSFHSSAIYETQSAEKNYDHLGLFALGLGLGLGLALHGVPSVKDRELVSVHEQAAFTGDSHASEGDTTEIEVGAPIPAVIDISVKSCCVILPLSVEAS
ncbi:hypothetical protein ACFX2G_034761 [Malus domestica]